MKFKMDIDWNLKAPAKTDLKIDLANFKRYLIRRGLREVTINGYIYFAGKYLASGLSVPEYLDGLQDRHLARNSINNYINAIKAYHKMLGQPLDDLRVLRTPEIVPYYFEEEEVRKILKHHNEPEAQSYVVLTLLCLSESK